MDVIPMIAIVIAIVIPMIAIVIRIVTIAIKGFFKMGESFYEL